MVLEHILPDEWLKKKARFAFLLGVCYAMVGILFAKVLFPADPALVSVAFISLLLLPELRHLFDISERREEREKKFSFKKLYTDNKDFVGIYLLLFLGIMATYAALTLVMDNFSTNQLFHAQLAILGNYGGAVNVVGAGSGLFCHAGAPLTSFSAQACIFTKLLMNNLVVLLACFLLSLVTGDGAVFFITWNASVWGTLFGTYAHSASMIYYMSPLIFFAIIMGIVFPHMVLEALAYIMAAVSGGTISKDVLTEKFDSRRFNHVFRYNAMLFLVALAILLLGVLVETLVLTHSTTYMSILQTVY